MKIWANTNDAYGSYTTRSIKGEARDVAVSEGDGSIMVTGWIEQGFTLGSTT